MDIGAKFILDAVVRGQTQVDGLRKSVEGVGRAGEMSAKQTAAAFRTLPAQMTDIATQLAGGQNPLLILLQQGGQIKDSFGGIRPAISALASAITPARLAVGGLATAAGVMALAFWQGEKQTEAFNRAIALTGNQAGMTASAFENATQRIKSASGVTVGMSRALLQGAVGTGAFGSLTEEAATAMAKLQKISGQSADDVVKDFASMRKGVAEWAAEHNRQYAYLTVEQYKYIRQLEKQGDIEGAMRANIEALDKAMADRTVQLGYLQQAWKNVGEFASWAWDKMLGLGREQSTGDKLAELQQTLQDRIQRGPMFSDTRGAWEKGNEQLRKQIELLREQSVLEGRQARAQSENAAKERKAIDEIASGRAKATSEAGLALEMEKARQAAALAAIDVEQQLARLEAQKRAGMIGDIAYIQQKTQIERAGLEAKVRLLEREIAIESRRSVDPGPDAIQQQAKLLGMRTQLAEARSKIGLNAIIGTSEEEAERLSQSRDNAQKWADTYKQAYDKAREFAKQARQAEISQIVDSADRARAEAEAAAEEIRRELADIQRDLQLRIDLTVDPAQAALLRQQLDAITQGASKRLTQIGAEAPKQGGWMGGLEMGMKEWGRRAQDIAGQVKDALTNAFESASDALANFVMTGKLNFKDFARSVLADLAKLIAKQLVFNAVKAGAQFFGIPLPFAKGGAFANGVQAFANGGVVNSPTLFPFANGGQVRTGLMGEAGPEAIMPLQRGADGKLGVRAVGGTAGGISIGSIVVQGGGGEAVSDTSGNKAAELGRSIAGAVRMEIMKQQRPGGLLYA